MAHTAPWEEGPIKIYEAESLPLWLQMGLTTRIQVVFSILEREEGVREFKSNEGGDSLQPLSDSISADGTEGGTQARAGFWQRKVNMSADQSWLDFSQNRESRVTWNTKSLTQGNNKVLPEGRDQATFLEWMRVDQQVRMLAVPPKLIA